MSATITAEQIATLRQRTGVGFLDCKKALVECGGDLEAATDFLRKKGLAAAGKKASRATTEGAVALATQGDVGVVLEVNSETDFVARNEVFQHFVGALAEQALAKGAASGEALLTHDVRLADGTTHKVEDALSHLTATIGEAIRLRRMTRLEAKEGALVSYVHSALKPGLGKIGVLLALKIEGGDKALLKEKARPLAMHVAAAAPKYLSKGEVPAEDVERERAVLLDQAKASGGAEKFLDKMVEGRLGKFYEAIVLEEQVFMLDTSKRIRDVLADLSKTCGGKVSISGFARFALGEGLEKKETDFAAEVQAQL